MKQIAPFIVYLLLYALCLTGMHLEAGFGVPMPLMVLLLFGLGLSLLALWSSRPAKPRDIPVKEPRYESALLAAYLLPFVAFITWGLPWVRSLSSQPVLQAGFVLTAKLLVAVIIPLALWRWRWRYLLHEFVDLRAGLSGHWRPLLVLAPALCVLQWLVGSARGQLAGLHPAAWELMAAVVLGSLWLFFEVGIVEEFFFRGLVQARVAALTGSQSTGLVAMALLFGLAHAPGLYLRPAATGEGLGDHPSLFLAVGYSIVVTSAAGFFLGFLWIRTRNLLLLALIHAAGDLLPNLAQVIRWWRGA